MQRNTGFTLIELLVVIAIIGILASVVLASLNSARAKGADAAVTQTVNNMRAQAELYYDSNFNSYLGMCESPSLQQALTAVATQGSLDYTCVDGDDVANSWAMEARLISSTTAYYCVDYDGSAGTQSGSTIGSSDAVCG